MLYKGEGYFVYPKGNTFSDIYFLNIFWKVGFAMQIGPLILHFCLQEWTESETSQESEKFPVLLGTCMVLFICTSQSTSQRMAVIIIPQGKLRHG